MIWELIPKFFRNVVVSFLFFWTPRSVAEKWYGLGHSDCNGFESKHWQCVKHAKLSSFSDKIYSCDGCLALMRWRKSIRYEVGHKWWERE